MYMNEHLPECWAKHESDPPAWCICDELRACEQRVFALHPEWTMTGLCKPDCAACRRLTELITEWEYGYEKGLDAVREAVEAIPAPYKVKGQYETYGPHHEGKSDMKDLCISAIDALKEDQ